MKKIFLTFLIGFLCVACSTKRQIDYTSPCACYEIEKTTKFKG